MDINNNFEAVKKHFEHDEFASGLGIELTELNDETIKMEMVLKENMNNLFGKPHGAVIFGFTDAAFSVLVNNDNNLSVALDCSISYQNAADAGERLFLEGKKLSTSRKICLCLFEVFKLNDGKPIPIATMKGTAYRTGRPIIKD